MLEEANKTIVIGHKNPDTDSICSAICYARYKEKMVGGTFIAGRAGNINPETQFVLDYFKVEAPELIKSVSTQVKDIEVRETKGVNKNISLRKAWELMQEGNVVTLPAVNRSNRLEGLITVGDITMSYMNVYDNTILAKAKTLYKNIVETLEGELLVGDINGVFDKGKVLIAAANPDVMESFIEKGDLVILGNRYESQLCAIEMEAAGIIVSGGSDVSRTIKKLAAERGCTIITTHYDTYTTARLMNQSMPISFFMRKAEELITFRSEDYLNDIKDIMASKRYRDFPVLNPAGKYVGMISRRNVIAAKGKNVMLVDHNERNQAVDGIEDANILAIIDHHRLGTMQTIQPVLFRNQPVGCTATILYQMYTEHGLEIDKQTAGLLLAAIISDTLLFRSPTFTDCDREAAEALQKIAGIDPEKFAVKMFSAGSQLKGKTDAEILHQDFKKFTSGKVTFCVGQVSSMDDEELRALEKRMPAYMEKALEEEGVDMLFLMLTNILTETTILVSAGHGADQLAEEAFSAGMSAGGGRILPGVVSRKKQLIPALSSAIAQ